MSFVNVDDREELMNIVDMQICECCDEEIYIDEAYICQECGAIVCPDCYGNGIQECQECGGELQSYNTLVEE